MSRIQELLQEFSEELMYQEIKSDFGKELKMNTYILKTVDGGKFKIKAKDLIELIKEINLIFIDELQYEIEDFISLTDKNFNEVELTENEDAAS